MEYKTELKEIILISNEYQYDDVYIFRNFNQRELHIAILLTGIISIIPFVAIFDPIAASYNGRWPWWVHYAAAGTTHLAKAHWWLVPAALIAVGGSAAMLLLEIRNSRMTGLVAYSWVFLVAVGGVGACSSLLKYLIGRARPVHFHELGLLYLDPLPFKSEAGFSLNASFASFPSGHATTIAAACTMIAMRWPHLGLAALALALWLAATRVIVGAHYPSDVLAGLLLGSFGVILVGKRLSLSVVSRLMGIKGVDATPVSAPAPPLAPQATDTMRP